MKNQRNWMKQVLMIKLICKCIPKSHIKKCIGKKAANFKHDGNDFVNLFEDGTRLKIHSEISPPLPKNNLLKITQAMKRLYCY